MCLRFDNIALFVFQTTHEQENASGAKKFKGNWNETRDKYV